MLIAVSAAGDRNTVLYRFICSFNLVSKNRIHNCPRSEFLVSERTKDQEFLPSAIKGSDIICLLLFIFIFHIFEIKSYTSLSVRREQILLAFP